MKYAPCLILPAVFACRHCLHGSNDLHVSSKSKATALTVTRLPANGERIHARLITCFGSVQVVEDYTYKAK